MLVGALHGAHQARLLLVVTLLWRCRVKADEISRFKNNFFLETFCQSILLYREEVLLVSLFEPFLSRILLTLLLSFKIE